jgi:hypothetical protein
MTEATDDRRWQSDPHHRAESTNEVASALVIAARETPCDLQASIERADLEKVLPGKTDPYSLVTVIAKLVRSGVQAEIKGYRLLAGGRRLYKDDPEQLEVFHQGLVDENLIPRRSARLGPDTSLRIEKSQLSMMCTVGENDHLLLDNRIFKYLRPGRSLLYHVVRLHRELPGEFEERTERLASRLEKMGQICRSGLIDEIKKEIENRKTPTEREPDPWETPASQRLYDLVLLTPDSRHVRRAEESYHSDFLPRCMRTHENVSDDAVAIVLGRMSDLPVVKDKLLAGCGFDAPWRLFLLRRPLKPDVTEEEVVVLAQRSSQDRVRYSEFTWLDDDETVDANSLVSRLVPTAANKLHVFASVRCEGWDSLIGDENWDQTT